MIQKFIHQVWRFTFNVTSGLDTHQAMRFTSSDTRSIDYKEAEFTMGHNPCFRVPEDVSRLLREQILTKMGGRFIESFRQKQNIMPCLLSLNRWSCAEETWSGSTSRSCSAAATWYDVGSRRRYLQTGNGIWQPTASVLKLIDVYQWFVPTCRMPVYSVCRETDDQRR